MVISDFFHLRLWGLISNIATIYSVCSSRPAFPKVHLSVGGWGGGGGGGGPTGFQFK